MPEIREHVSPAEAAPPYFGGIDVGGTNIKFGIADCRGRTLGADRIPTEAERGPQDAAMRMGAAVRALADRLGIAWSSIARLGLATPGTMDIPAGRLLTPGNLPAWHGAPIRDLTSEAAGIPVTFANDANAAAYGEYWCGAGAESESMIMFTLGTGIGGGIIDQGQLVDGSHSSGGELGHIVIDCHPDAPENSLGLRGTLEGYCGSYAVVGRARLAAERSGGLLVEKMSAGAELTPLLIAQCAEAGDSVALQTVLETADYLSVGIASMVHAFDPDYVVLGGAMTFGGAGHPLGEQFIERVRTQAYLRMFTHLRGQVRIDFASLGSDAGYLGSAGLACRDHFPDGAPS
ncbi:MAG: ROK family protein [Planctomycetales bacterium]|nr:ROK family protein [Planctomycetales bacterium]